MTEHVIALDPGERTGFASARLGKDSFELTDIGVMTRHHMAMQLSAWQAVTAGGVTKLFDRIVWESWTPRPQNGSMEWIRGDKLLSARHVGHFELIAWQTGTPTWEFGPNRKEGFQMSMAPQLVEIQREQSEQHSKDAMMHLWGWFFSNWFTGVKSPEDCIVA